MSCEESFCSKRFLISNFMKATFHSISNGWRMKERERGTAGWLKGTEWRLCGVFGGFVYALGSMCHRKRWILFSLWMCFGLFQSFMFHLMDTTTQAHEHPGDTFWFWVGLSGLKWSFLIAEHGWWGWERLRKYMCVWSLAWRDLTLLCLWRRILLPAL